jgi:protein O-GlcNAc transferase
MLSYRKVASYALIACISGVGYLSLAWWRDIQLSSVTLPSASIPILDSAETAPDKGTVFRSTTIPPHAHAWGFTVFDHLYLRNGTFYVVTANVSSFPPRTSLISPPVNSKAKKEETLPTDKVRDTPLTLRDDLVEIEIGNALHRSFRSGGHPRDSSPQD